MSSYTKFRLIPAPGITHTDGERYGLLGITGMGYGHRNSLATKSVDSKCYGFSQVMGYLGMGYLRFYCDIKLILYIGE